MYARVSGAWGNFGTMTLSSGQLATYLMVWCWDLHVFGHVCVFLTCGRNKSMM
jgi:hypothetical protein